MKRISEGLDDFMLVLLNPITESKYSSMVELNRQMESIFSNELCENKESVLEAIESDDYSTDPREFYNSFKKAKLSKTLTPYNLSDFSKMKTFKLNGYNIGFALKKFDNKGYSEIVAVHNAEPGIKGIGVPLMASVVKHGGLYLDHYDGFLSDLYVKSGFVEYQRYEFDPQYDPTGEIEKELNGRPDIVYRRYKSAPKP